MTLLALTTTAHGTSHGTGGVGVLLSVSAIGLVVCAYVLLAARRREEPRGWRTWRTVSFGLGGALLAAAALGLGAGPGDVVLSVGTSGVVSAVTETATADVDGLISGFADATGRFLPLAATLNGARVLDAWPPLAAAMVPLALDAAARGLAGPPHAIRPLYVRRPDAEIARDLPASSDAGGR